MQPNQISIFGVLISGLAATLLVLSRDADVRAQAALLAGAAICIPIRAACNMFDGMLAVEFGKATNSGAVFNELPDRISDALMLVGAGYAVPESQLYGGLSAALGWGAALSAATTAYVRTLGASLGVGQDFSGIMAKQQRMAVMTVALAVSAFENLWSGEGEVIVAGLAVVLAGCAVTTIQRTVGLTRRLGQQ